MEMINTLGRRKTAVARLYLNEGKGNIVVNKRDYKDYFKTGPLRYSVTEPLKLLEMESNFDLKVNVAGGGVAGQAEAVRLAIARALCLYNIEHKTTLKSHGLLTRDPRMVERKKPGQPKARKKFQFSKR